MMKRRHGILLGGTTALGNSVAPPAKDMVRIIVATTPRPHPQEAHRVGAAASGAAREREAERAARNAEHERFRREREERDARETAWVRDQFERDNAAAGNPVDLVDVEAVYDGWKATVLQWLPHGIREKVEHTLRHTRANYGDDHKEPKLRKVVTRRFAKLLRIQADMGERLGRPRKVDADEIDLSRFVIEAPLAAILEEVLGKDAGPRLRAAMAQNRPALEGRWNRECDEARLRTGVEGVELQFGRETIRGAFQTSGGRFSFRWSKGGLQLFGTSIPDSLVPAMVGRRVGEVVEHPLLDPGMLITSATLMGRNGDEGVALTVKDATRPVPAGW